MAVRRSGRGSTCVATKHPEPAVWGVGDRRVTKSRGRVAVRLDTRPREVGDEETVEIVEVGTPIDWIVTQSLEVRGAES